MNEKNFVLDPLTVMIVWLIVIKIARGQQLEIVQTKTGGIINLFERKSLW